MKGSEKGSQFGDMRSVASKSDMPSYAGILDRTGKISINTELFKAFGVESVQAPSKYEAPQAAKAEEKPAQEEHKEKDHDPDRQLPVVDGSNRKAQVYHGSALNMGAVQSKLLESMATKE